VTGDERHPDKRNSGWESPGERLAKVEKDLHDLHKKGCSQLPLIKQEVRSVKTLGYALLGMQTIVLIGVLSLFFR
jgi:hypothetical protein